jgi:hypothetical protein
VLLSVLYRILLGTDQSASRLHVSFNGLHDDLCLMIDFNVQGIPDDTVTQIGDSERFRNQMNGEH